MIHKKKTPLALAGTNRVAINSKKYNSEIIAPLTKNQAVLIFATRNQLPFSTARLICDLQRIGGAV